MASPLKWKLWNSTQDYNPLFSPFLTWRMGAYRKIVLHDNTLCSVITRRVPLLIPKPWDLCSGRGKLKAPAPDFCQQYHNRYITFTGKWGAGGPKQQPWASGSEQTHIHSLLDTWFFCWCPWARASNRQIWRCAFIFKELWKLKYFFRGLRKWLLVRDFKSTIWFIKQKMKMQINLITVYNFCRQNLLPNKRLFNLKEKAVTRTKATPDKFTWKSTSL